MSILGFIKTRNEDTGEPVLRDRPTVLAYMEELIRLQKPVQIWMRKGDLTPTAGRIDALQEDDGIMRIALQRSIPGDILPPCPMEMFFMIDGQRFLTQIRFKTRDAYLKACFKIPEVVRHAERRSRMRTRFSPRERASTTVLEGIFDGIGASGALVNLSMEGLCMKIERAIHIRENRNLPVSTDLFTTGKCLPIVRILNLPRTPTIECSGTVAHLSVTPGGVLMGLRLECLGQPERDLIEQILTRRLPRFNLGFPVKRRWAELNIDPLEEGEGEGGEEGEEEEDKATDPEPSSGQPENAAAMVAAVHEEHRQRLRAIRKRGRHILVLAGDEMDRSILSGTLFVDGYTQVTSAGNLLEALRACRKTPPDLVIMEERIGPTEARDFLARLRAQGNLEDIPVVMLSSTPGVRTTLIAKSAGIAHVQAIPTDYDGEMRGLISQLLGLE